MKLNIELTLQSLKCQSLSILYFTSVYQDLTHMENILKWMQWRHSRTGRTRSSTSWCRIVHYGPWNCQPSSHSNCSQLFGKEKKSAEDWYKGLSVKVPKKESRVTTTTGMESFYCLFQKDSADLEKVRSVDVILSRFRKTPMMNQLDLCIVQRVKHRHLCDRLLITYTKETFGSSLDLLELYLLYQVRSFWKNPPVIPVTNKDTFMLKYDFDSLISAVLFNSAIDCFMK